MKLTLSQRRFLIVWIIFHSLALFVNLAEIRGAVPSDDVVFKDSLGTKVYRSSHDYFLTSGSNNDFWPFTSFTTNVSSYPSYSDGRVEVAGFNGIFNSYTYKAFIFYILLGFAIVYVPKLWSNS